MTSSPLAAFAPLRETIRFGCGLAALVFPISSPPNVFIGGPVRVLPRFPLKACGNDGLARTRYHQSATSRNLAYRMALSWLSFDSQLTHYLPLKIEINYL